MWRFNNEYILSWDPVIRQFKVKSRSWMNIGGCHIASFLDAYWDRDFSFLKLVAWVFIMPRLLGSECGLPSKFSD